MVICSPFRVAVTSPAANLAVWPRFGIKLSAATALYSLLQAISNSTIVRGIIQISEHLLFEARSGCHHVSEFGREVLRVRQQIGIQAYLEDGIPFCLASKLRIDYLIRPGAQTARLLDAPQNIQASTPSRSFEGTLSDNRRPAAHCIKGLARVPSYRRRFHQHAQNIKPARLKMSEIALFMQSASLRENFQKWIPDKRLIQLAVSN